MILPGETSVEVYSEIFNCLSLRDVCLVYLHWRALHCPCLRAKDMWDDLDHVQGNSDEELLCIVSIP
jgi:hypothetical protein